MTASLWECLQGKPGTGLDAPQVRDNLHSTSPLKCFMAVAEIFTSQGSISSISFHNNLRWRTSYWMASIAFPVRSKTRIQATKKKTSISVLPGEQSNTFTGAQYQPSNLNFVLVLHHSYPCLGHYFLLIHTHPPPFFLYPAWITGDKLWVNFRPS